MRKYIFSLSLAVCFLFHGGAMQAHEAVCSLTAGYEKVYTDAFAGVALPSGYLTIANDTQSSFNLYVNGGFVKVIAANEHSTVPVSTDYELGSIGVSATDYTTHTIDFIDHNGAQYSKTSTYAYYSDVDLTPYCSLHIY